MPDQCGQDVHEVVFYACLINISTYKPCYTSRRPTKKAALKLLFY